MEKHFNYMTTMTTTRRRRASFDLNGWNVKLSIVQRAEGLLMALNELF
jgi:hypothetical protein